MTTTLRQSPYLQKQRNFPGEIEDLTNEIDKTYIDVASKVNDRTIGTFALGVTIITGEQWHLSGQNPQQTVRKLFKFTSASPISHGINLSQIAGFTSMYGQYTDGTKWYGVIAATDKPIANQLTFYVDTANIILTLDGTAPAISSGFIVLEWLSQA